MVCNLGKAKGAEVESDETAKAARKRYMRGWLEKNREHVRDYRRQTADGRNARRRELYAQDEQRRIQAREDARAWQEAHPAKRKAQRLRAFGIGLDEYKQMLDAQGGKCAICGFQERSDPNFFPVVDHCHETGKVRGLLCANCNHILGKAKDNPDVLRAAAEYLEKNA
jgi:hypothetical protein